MIRFSELYRFNSVYNASGLPAMTLPFHFSRSGLPIRMMFGAGFGKEAILFRLAGQLKRAMPWAGRHPPHTQSLDVTANRRRMGAIVSGRPLARLPRALLFATGKDPRASHHSSADHRNCTLGRVRARSAVMPPHQPAP